MALLCYSNLDDDDRVGVSVLHASLESWVSGLLADTQERSTRPPARFAPQAEGRAPRDETVALQSIRFIRYAQEQLRDRNAYLRYLCPDCPRDGGSNCPARNRARPAAGAVHGILLSVRVEPLSVPRGTWPEQTRPAASRVFERLRRIVEQLRTAAASAGTAAAHTALLISHIYGMARMWRTRGLGDHAVNVDEELDGLFLQDVMGALIFTHDGAETTDARHSPVNFIAAVLHTLAEQWREPQTFTPREAVMAALVARNAAIEGNTAAVDEFSRTWLGLTRPRPWRPAVEMALLGNWVASLGQRLNNDAEIMELLHRHTDREHRCLRPLWQRKSGGLRVRLLDDRMASGVPLRDLITDHRRPEDNLLSGEVEDPRIRAVLTRLAPAERAVAMTYGSEHMTWAQAAAEGGAEDPEAFGERVRRKLKRLGARQTAGPSATAAVAGR